MTANPDVIRAASKKSFEQAGRNGRFILSPGCEVPPQTPPENLETLVESAILFASYTPNGL
jgi:uroporphyrinogen-III decarboxylase